MDGISSRLTEILQNPGMMEQIRGLASMLGKEDTASNREDTERKASVSPVASVPSASRGAELFPAEMTGWMLRLLPMLQSFQQETDETRFLASLRPLLSAERRRKLDGAIQLMKAMQLLPLVKQVTAGQD